MAGAATPAADCELAYLCVPTPRGDDGSADLSYIESVAREIAPALPHGAIVVNKTGCITTDRQGVGDFLGLLIGTRPRRSTVPPPPRPTRRQRSERTTPPR